jgi:hypothetical protein
MSQDKNCAIEYIYATLRLDLQLIAILAGGRGGDIQGEFGSHGSCSSVAG